MVLVFDCESKTTVVDDIFGAWTFMSLKILVQTHSDECRYQDQGCGKTRFTFNDVKTLRKSFQLEDREADLEKEKKRGSP